MGSIKENLRFVKYIFKKQNALPIYVIFEPTSICNSKCSFCYNWKTVQDKKNELSIEQIDKLSKTMNNKLLTLALSGGEPFLRKDLPEIIKIFQKNTNMNHLSIPTNGLLPDTITATTSKILEFYKQKMVVLISLDGIGNRHDKIRGIKGNFKKVLETYQKLTDLKAKNLEISINTCISSANQEEYKRIYQYVKENMPKISVHNFSFMRGTPPDKSIKSPSKEFIENNKEILKKIALGNKGYSFDPFNQFIKSTKARYYDIVSENQKSSVRKWKCYAGQLTAYIDCYGNVWPCEPFKPFGNLKDFDYNFRALWFSKKAEEIRKEIKEKKCNCDHGCFIYMNIMFNPKEYFHLIKYATK